MAHVIPIQDSLGRKKRRQILFFGRISCGLVLFAFVSFSSTLALSKQNMTEAMDSRPEPPPLDPVIPTYEARL